MWCWYAWHKLSLFRVSQSSTVSLRQVNQKCQPRLYNTSGIYLQKCDLVSSMNHASHTNGSFYQGTWGISPIATMRISMFITLPTTLWGLRYRCWWKWFTKFRFNDPLGSTLTFSGQTWSKYFSLKFNHILLLLVSDKLVTKVEFMISLILDLNNQLFC